MSKPSKKKMATSREVYDRIVWDARLNRNAFAIAYLDRGYSNSIREKPLSEWVSNGDIPWHRIRYIRVGETIVWDRDRHLDLFSSGQLPASAFATHSQEAPPVVVATTPPQYRDIVPAFQARPVYGYAPPGWQPVSLSVESVRLSALAIATFNVLSDMHEAELIQTAKRLPAIVEHLRTCNADIVALQEVTPPLLELLLAIDWVRQCFISESPEASTIQPYGLLILSRLPFTLVEHKYSAHKRVLVGTWHLNGGDLHVAVVHLPSNRAHNAVELRARQLAALLDYLNAQPGDCAIVGDFNGAGDEQDEVLIQSGFVDVWKALHGLEAGYTFDPNRNTLAALMSMTGQAGRLDRILLRARNEQTVARSLELFACEPIPDTEGKLYASDHFGLRAVLEFSIQSNDFLRSLPPVYQSAVVVIPPVEFWPPIQVIRRRCDRNIDRWMPHFNLLYGFIPEEHFEEAALIISQALADVKPFEVTLTGFETFEHRQSSTAWLRPVTQPPKALHQLQTILQQLFPQCNEQSTKSSAGFTPHLSVGQFSSSKEAIAQLSSWHPLSFPVDSVALISRRGDNPFEVRYVVHLGGDGGLGKIFPIPQSPFTSPYLMQLVDKLEPDLSVAERSHRETILAVVKQACAECLGQQPSLHLLGSARLGVESPQSDLDVVCLIPAYLSGEAFLLNVQEKLLGLCDRSRLVEDALVPVLRMQIEGVSVDLLYARTNGELTAEEIWARQDFDPVSWKAIVGCLEADAIAFSVQEHISMECFRFLLRAVRSWAKARQVHANAWGFFGSFSWALLAAWSCTQYPQDLASPGLELLLAHFFKVCAEWDWSQPVALTEAGRGYRIRVPPDWLPVVTSIAPCQNSARNVSRSTADILRGEFVRGAEVVERVLAGKIGWEVLFEAVDLPAKSPLFLVLTARSEDGDRLEICRGWLEGHVIGLVIDIEQQLDARVRPWPGIRSEQNVSRFILGVELFNDGDRPILEQIGIDFVLQFNAGNAYPDGSILESAVCDRQWEYLTKA